MFFIFAGKSKIFSESKGGSFFHMSDILFHSALVRFIVKKEKQLNKDQIVTSNGGFCVFLYQVFIINIKIKTLDEYVTKNCLHLQEKLKITVEK